MSKMYFKNGRTIELKGVVVRDLQIKNKYQTKDPEYKILKIRPKGLLEGFARFDGTIDIKLPLEFDQDIKVDDIVEFTELSVTPYSFKDKSFVSYSVKATTCEVISHLDY